MPAFPPHGFVDSAPGAPAPVPTAVHGQHLGPTLALLITSTSNSTPPDEAASVPASAAALVFLPHVPSVARTPTAAIPATFVNPHTAPFFAPLVSGTHTTPGRTSIPIQIVPSLSAISSMTLLLLRLLLLKSNTFNLTIVIKTRIWLITVTAFINLIGPNPLFPGSVSITLVRPSYPPHLLSPSYR